MRLIGEQLVLEDLGRIPSFADRVRAIRPEPWLGRTASIPDSDGLLQRHGLPGMEPPTLQAAITEAAP